MGVPPVIETLVFPFEGEESRLGRMSWISLPETDGGLGDAVRDGADEDAFELGVGSRRASGCSRSAKAEPRDDLFSSFCLAGM